MLLQLLSLTHLVFSFRIMNFLILSFYVVSPFFLKGGLQCSSAPICLLPSKITFENKFFFFQRIYRTL